MTRYALIAVFTLPIAACVTKGTHEQVQRELSQARRELESSRGEAEDLRDALADEQRRVADLEEQIEMLGADESELRSTLANVVKDHSRLEASVEEMAAALAELQERKRQAERRIAEYRDLLARFGRMIDAGKLKVAIVDGRIVLQMQTDILFPTGSAKLSSAGATAITEVAGVLATLEGKRFQVEGHTDDVPIRNERYPSNWELAQARALRVVKTMIAAGMPADQIGTAAFGEHRPRASNDTAEGRALNRRIEIVMLPDLSQLPGTEELRRLAGPA